LKPFAAFSSSSHQHHGTQNMLRPRPAPPKEEAVSKSEEIDSSVAHHGSTKHSLQLKQVEYKEALEKLSSVIWLTRDENIL
jgi:hypothetical protein